MFSCRPGSSDHITFHSRQTLHFHLNLLLASLEPINNPAECVICMMRNRCGDDRKKTWMEWRWRLFGRSLHFDPQKKICLGRINKRERLMTVWLGAEKTRAAVQKYFENSLLLCGFFFFIQGKQINVPHLVRAPSEYITCPWFLPRFQDARQVHRMCLTS